MYAFVLVSILAAFVVMYYEIRLKTLKGLVIDMTHSKSKLSLPVRIAKSLVAKRWISDLHHGSLKLDTKIEILHMFRKHSLKQFLGFTEMGTVSEILAKVHSAQSAPFVVFFSLKMR